MTKPFADSNEHPDDGKEIRFEDGLITVGGRFTDIHLAMSGHPPDFAGIDSSFTGILVPEPAKFALLALGLALVAFTHKKVREEIVRCVPR